MRWLRNTPTFAIKQLSIHWEILDMNFIRNSVLFIFGSFTMSILICSCNQLDDQLTKQADLTGKATAERTQEVANEDLKTKSLEKEVDLSSRQRFYQGVTGIFMNPKATEIKGSKTNFYRHFEFIITATVPPYFGSRIRALEEVIADLNGLKLAVEEKDWDENDVANFGTHKCTFPTVVSEYNTGVITLPASPECAEETYILELISDGIVASGPTASVSGETSRQVASQLRAGDIAEAKSLFVTLSGKTKDLQHFTVERQ